jgi:chromosome segregation ATPase
MSDELKASTLDQLGLNRGVADAVKILSGAGDQIRGYEEQLRSAGGMTEKVADKQMGSLKAQTDLMKNAFSELGIMIGSLVSERLTKMVKSITKLTQSITTTIGKFKDWKEELEEQNKAMQENVHGVEVARVSYSKYSYEVDKAKNETKDFTSATDQAINATKGAENASRQRITTQDIVNNALKTFTRDTEDSTDAVEENTEALKEQAEEMRSKALPSLQRLVNAQEALHDIQEKIKDAEEDRDDAVKDVTKAEEALNKATTAKDLLYGKMILAQEEAKKVTDEEKLAILQQKEAVKKLEEAEEKSEIQALKLKLAKEKLNEMIDASTKANYESESAVRAYEQAVEEEKRALESLTKAQDALTEAQDEFNEVTAQTPKNLLEIALAKKELDDAIKDINALGTFEEALSQMVELTGARLADLQAMFDKLMSGSPITSSDIKGNGGGNNNGDGSTKTGVDGGVLPSEDKALQNILSDDRFAFKQGQRGGVTTIMNIQTTVEGSVLAEQDLQTAVASAVVMAQRNGTKVIL